MNEEINRAISRGPVIVIGDGTSCQMFFDTLRNDSEIDLAPMVRASYVARLRALADLLEAG